MRWTPSNLPRKLKALPVQARKRATRLANRLVKEGHAESRAIAMATNKAWRWAAQQPRRMRRRIVANPGKDLRVEPRGDKWALRSRGAQRAVKVFATKQQALRAGMARAKQRHARLIMHRKDGVVQQTWDLRSTAGKAHRARAH